MVKEFDISKLNEAIEIWLGTNVAVHDFIPKEYWVGNYEIAKKLFQGQIYWFMKMML